MVFRTSVLVAIVAFCSAVQAANPPINLDVDSPYYPNRSYPKLTTPQWIGEEGVDAVVILAIDDMRDHRRYETFLRPILDRLKKIDGRAPLSIMTCKIDPQTPALQGWLKEGLSFEVHTVEHPCPILAGGDFARAKSTYDRCLDQIASIPNNSPVAFRIPCCDSLNTPSPRLYAEIFNKTSPGGNFLSIDSSVSNVTSANDPALPRELVLEKDGRERFRKYLPFDSFVNTIDDYPYPYIIGRLCWEFPCATPSDWEAQFVHKQNASPITTADWKAQLDVTVIKKGVMTMVFHPYGWSAPEQWVELIDYAQSKYGKRVTFLNFREANDRLTKNLLAGAPLRAKDGSDSQIRLLDLNKDGYLDVVRTGDHDARIWNPETKTWSSGTYPENWKKAEAPATDHQGYLRDLNHDGQPELIVGEKIYTWEANDWKPLPFTLPAGMSIETGAFFVDINEDGFDDLIFSNSQRSAFYLFESMSKGWTRKVRDNQRDGGKNDLPMVVRPDGTNNGLWVHSRTLWWQNEDTAKMPNLVDRRTFNELLAGVEPLAKSPAASLASIKVVPGYQVELVATEPLVQDPIAFAFGPDGKLWVVEMGDYPLGIDGKGKAGGHIKYLEDTNGDGVYDEVTLFLQDIPYPTSVLPWKNGVLVAAAPEIFYAEDTDGDGKADKRELLFTGFREGNQQHRVNHLSFGLDNWIYGANGESGGNVKSLKTGKTVSISGRDFRFKPDTGEFEAVAGGGQFARSRTDAGDWFGNNNSNPLWHYPLDEAYLKRNPYVNTGTLRVEVLPTPGAAPVYPISPFQARFNDFHTANHFTSACAAHVYRDDLFAKTGHEIQIFISEPVHNLIHREIVTRAGSTFAGHSAQGEDSTEFLASSDNWFRPTTIETGPDGALYIADMYRQTIEHPQWIPKETQAKLDLRLGHDMGRIYRVSPVASQRRPIPRLDKLDTAGLVAALDSSNGWQRDMAQAMLISRNDKQAIPLLEKLSAKNPTGRLSALCALEGLGATDVPTLKTALNDSDPEVRRHALRLAEGKLGDLLDAKLLQSLTNDQPQVRLQLACSLGTWDDPRAAEALARLLTDPQSDRFLLTAALSSLSDKNIAAVAANITSGRHAPPAPEVLAGILRTAVGTKQTKAVGDALAALTAPKEGKFQPWQFKTLANLLDSLAEAKTSLPKFFQGDDAAASAKRVENVIASARSTLQDQAASLDLRSSAVELMMREDPRQKEDLALLDRLLTPQSPSQLQAAIIAHLSHARSSEGAKLLLDHWKELTPELRAQAIDGLLTRPERAAILVDAIEAKKVLVIEIDAPRRQRLLMYPNKTLRERATALLANTINPNRQKVIDSFADAVNLSGDAKKGKELFGKTCATCHRLGDTGNAVGPDLASVGDKSSPALLIAILDPNRAVEARYVNYIVTTNDDQTLTGLLASESATSITLLGPDAKPIILRRSDLKELRSSNMSLMPEGLEAAMTAQDLADLMAFVRAGK